MHNVYNRRIEFGKHEACHLVVVASQQHIAVWNILTLALTWSVSLNVVSLTYDPKSTYMAAFTSDNSCMFLYHISFYFTLLRKYIVMLEMLIDCNILQS